MGSEQARMLSAGTPGGTLMRLIFVALTLAALLLSATCGGDPDPTATPTPSPAPPAAGSDSIPVGAGESGTFEVLIKFLKHSDIEIPVGTTVVWDSTSATEDISRRFHTVTSGNPGESWGPRCGKSV